VRTPVVLGAAVLLCFGLAGSAQEIAHRPNPGQSRGERTREFLGLGPVPDAAAATRGGKLFEQNCAFCHGAKATGAEGPDLLRSSLVLHDRKGELLGPFVRKGRPDKGMPAFAALTDAQLYDIAEFLHQRVEDVANRGLYQVQNVVTGNAEAGKAFFDSHCTQCHSATGDLAHIASKFDPADLQAQFLYPSRSAGFFRGGESTGPSEMATVTLPSGETVSGRLKYIDDFTISLYDSSGEYHSWPRSEVKVQIKDPLAGHRELLKTYTDADMHNLLAYLVTLK
jgi:mono/diheme cytochrome c family protein